MSNNYLNVEVESDFKYISNDSIADVISSDSLDFQMYFQSGDWLDSELEQIREELVETGKVFARNQGFSDGYIIKEDKSGKLRINTGTLIKSIKAEPVNLPEGKGIKFYNDATDGKGLYAGHIEYGFHDRGGNFIPARPFMRPALYAVAEGSKGNLSQIMRGLLEGLWSDEGFKGVSNLTFGKKKFHKGSTFWSSSKNFSKSLSQQSGFKKLKDDAHRNKMSVMNQHNKNSITKKRGFRFAPNKKEFTKLGVPIKHREQLYGKSNKGELNKDKSNKGKSNKGKSNKGKSNKSKSNKGKSNKKNSRSKSNKGKSNKGNSKSKPNKNISSKEKNKRKKMLSSVFMRLGG